MARWSFQCRKEATASQTPENRTATYLASKFPHGPSAVSIERPSDTSFHQRRANIVSPITMTCPKGRALTATS